MGYVPGTETNNIPFGVPLALRKYTELYGVQKFGYSAAVGTSFTTIWEGPTPYPYITTAGPVTLVSTVPGSDDGDTVLVEGLDANYDLLSETVTVGGAPSTNNFQRIFRMSTEVALTGSANVGNITASVGGVVRAYILAGEGQSLMAIYTVPNGHRAFLLSVYASPSKQKEMTVRLITRPRTDGSTFNVKAYGTSFGQSFLREYQINELLQPKTDIEVQCKVDATSAVSAGFELLVEKIN